MIISPCSLTKESRLSSSPSSSFLTYLASESAPLMPKNKISHYLELNLVVSNFIGPDLKLVGTNLTNLYYL